MWIRQLFFRPRKVIDTVNVVVFFLSQSVGTWEQQAGKSAW